MFARGRGRVFVAERRKRGDDLRARFARLDDVIHVASGGRIIWVVEFLAIFCGKFFAFCGGIVRQFRFVS